MRIIEHKLFLENAYKKLFGFILFDYSMHRGPVSFPYAEKTATEIGVLPELTEYAENWTNYSRAEQDRLKINN